MLNLNALPWHWDAHPLDPEYQQRQEVGHRAVRPSQVPGELRDELMETLKEASNDFCRGTSLELMADALLAGPLAPLLARIAELEQREREHLGLLGWMRKYLTVGDVPDDDVESMIDSLVALETGELPAFQRWEQGLRVRIAELEQRLADPAGTTMVSCAGGCDRGVRPRYAVCVGENRYCLDCAGQMIQAAGVVNADLGGRAEQAEAALAHYEAAQADAGRFVAQTRGQLRLYMPFTPDGRYQLCEGCGVRAVWPTLLAHKEHCMVALAERILSRVAPEDTHERT